ncbi:MAG: helix-turn-helix transcriptional regulator [Candidatus Doudnabacteria bacterium]|nr:helix-turn-helix transcriptional regulator [Candidatus Doudnabacteria bacterium]
MNEADKRKKMLKDLGERIRVAREESSKSQLQVGVAIGVSDKTISGYESGRIAPSIDKLMALAELFKLPIGYFLGSDPREYKVSTRLRAVEVSLNDLKTQLREIKLIAQALELDK